MIVLEPNKSIPVRKDIRNGQEILCVLRGSLELVCRDRTIELVEGDTAHFWSNPEVQSITNRSQELTIALWVGTL